MLYITEAIENDKPRDYRWHVGEKRPDTYGDPIAEIQADGHELDYIRERFSSIPMCDARIVTWKAPWAQFIYDHLV